MQQEKSNAGTQYLNLRKKTHRIKSGVDFCGVLNFIKILNYSLPSKPSSFDVQCGQRVASLEISLKQ